MKISTKHQRPIAILLASSILLSSCASSTIITSTPTGAKVYVDGEPVGTTPYIHSDTKIVGSATSVKLQKEGYEPFNMSFARNEEADVGAIIGGVFLWVPFLWTMKYKPYHTYELIPVSGTQPNLLAPARMTEGLKSKPDQLRELKKLLDEKIISQEEYEKEKKKVLGDN